MSRRCYRPSRASPRSALCRARKRPRAQTSRPPTSPDRGATLRPEGHEEVAAACAKRAAGCRPARFSLTHSHVAGGGLTGIVWGQKRSAVAGIGTVIVAACALVALVWTSLKPSGGHP
eukprot:7387335-Prymnesium_polylepis.1